MAGALLLLVGAGCAGLDAIREADERARDFEQRSVDTGRITIAVLPAEEGDELHEALAMTIEAEIVGGGDRMRLLVDAGDFRGANPNGPDGEIILAGDDLIYLRPMTPRTGLPRGKSWIEMDADEAERLIPEFEGLTQFVDAKGLLSTSSLPEDDATGTETIDGVETTRYELSAGLDEMDEAVGMPTEALEELQGATGGDLDMTAWLDDEGFMRRMRFPMRAGYLVPRLEDEDDVVMQFDVSDLGEDISIELPDDKDVLSL